MVVKTSMRPLDLVSMSQLISWGFLLACAWSLWLFVVQLLLALLLVPIYHVIVSYLLIAIDFFL